MAQPLYTTRIPHRYFVHTKWAVPKEPLGMATEGEEIDYSKTIKMVEGGGGHWRYCNMNKEICKHY